VAGLPLIENNAAPASEAIRTTSNTKMPMQKFWKNVWMMGGMLLLLVTGPGRCALDAKVAWRS
jgi:uncharacterized membrane protein YphA (DoxX/SURF4 family)